MKDYLKTWGPLVWFRQLLEYSAWVLGGSTGGAPHWQKQKLLSKFKQKFNLEILVETGTYLGDMVFAKRNEFSKIYSVELATVLFERAKKRFANYPQITILQGDSARVLPELVKGLSSPTLFWLDGHYSGGATARAEQDTPVAREVMAIIENAKQSFVILIDDARLFVGKDGYPTLPELETMLLAKLPNYKMLVETDVVTIYPK